MVEQSKKKQDVPYRKVVGMELDFVSGRLDLYPGENALGYSVVFKMAQDFNNFSVTAGLFIKDYLNAQANAIRPELDGLAYHLGYNSFYDAAGKITNNKSLFALFAASQFYMDQWSTGGLERCYVKPTFEIFDDHLLITTTQKFRWETGKPIEIIDLPLIDFAWVLNLMVGHGDSNPPTSVESKALVGYAHEEFVDVGTRQLRRGTRYMIGSDLKLGAISPEHILTAK